MTDRQPPLTSRLLTSPEASDLYTRATQCAFLSLAGQGRLPKKTLSQWLSQDRLYAQAYVRFIGGLISRVRLPLTSDASMTSTLSWRILTLLQGCLSGITRELQFFEETAKSHGLDLALSATGGELFGPNEITGKYIELFDSFGALASGNTGILGLLDGLVVLWATEKAYLDSWSFAKKQSEGQTRENDLDGGALREKFIPNWTSEEFEAFVKEIGECVDAYADELVIREDGVEECVEVFRSVLVLEEKFWPVVDGDAATR
ncbi:heme oxygenase-like protein [Xylariaceae sp. FL1019]|nr:heme oxygenase-like protein [Xylariaceae sp. FL1019]